MVVNGEEQGEEILKEFGIDMCMLWYLKWIMNKVIKYSIGNFVQSYVAAWMGGELGENGYMYIYVCVCVCVCVCMAEALWYPPEMITTLLIGYMPT